ncbi:MAG: hypothetical protein HOO67_02300, partial [Candidatus Peribacteraceae bacterium]|nr:hypothetical protein [Candidatus Peribacteraceae bacterium]
MQDIDFCIPISKGQRPIGYALLDEGAQAYIDKTLSKIPAPHRSIHYGDNAGKQKTANSKRSCKDAIVEAKIKFVSTGKQRYSWRFVCTDELLKLHFNAERNEWASRFEVSPDCLQFINSMNNFVWDSENLDKDDLKPLINWASHLVTAFEYFAINRFPKSESAGFREEKIR